jgi:rhamnosyltransferase
MKQMKSVQGPQIDTSQLVVLTVTYHPDIDLLARQIERIPASSWLVVVDNASYPDQVAAIDRLITARPRAALIGNESNRGLASALNQAAAHTFEHVPEGRYLLLLDQDSVPKSGSVEGLLKALIDLRCQDKQVACVGPRLIDTTTGLQHGFHCMKGGRWVRVYPSDLDRQPIRCANLNGSGTLMSADLFRALGGLDETLFIDHVDTEWSFRVQTNGLLLYGIPWATFEHNMGERGLRFWLFGWRVWPHRSAQRHYYLFRNALWLMRRNYVPTVWKFWAAAKLALTLTVHALIDPKRKAQLYCMARGLRDGLIIKTRSLK